MGKQISERVAVVTGAASGIGRPTAIELAEQGAKVVVTARRDEAFDELVERLGRHRAEAVPGDVTDAVLVMPASIDTPLFQQAAVHVGRAPKALSPTNPPERVARAIVRAAKRPRRELPVGRGARPMLMLHAVAPGVFER
ncbi:MAG TPA: SDR family NAD(P)-dependent oxidoreductase, partial [Solirubrobacteraceae bacterium]|nr:SDR family NAD(P)-dependent oxidoreductase [Solirubrobacteraceae bacterium]